MKKSLILISFLCLLMKSVSPTWAQEVSLSLSPTVQEVVTQPGHSFVLSFTLTNIADPQLVSVKLATIIPQTDGTVRMKGEVEGPIQISVEGENIAFNEPFFMKGNEKIRLNLLIQVPQVIQEKDYYMSLLMQSQAPPTNEGSITARTQLAVASNILVSVTSNGSLETKPKITAFYVPGEKRLKIFGKDITFVQTGQQVPLVLQVGNQGRHLIRAQGSIMVKGLGPKKNVTIQPQRVLASSQSKINESTLLSGFFFGPYTISASVNFGPGSPVIYANTTVFAVPSLPIFVLIFFVIVTIIVLRRRKK